MKNPVTQVAIAAIIIVILTELGVFNALTLFLLVGAIPGTDYSLPPAFMLFAMLGLMWFVLSRFAIVKSFRRRVGSKLAKRIRQHKKHTARHRFSQIRLHFLGRINPPA